MGLCGAKAANLTVDDQEASYDRVWTTGKQLGSGAYAVVYECVHKQSGQRAAVKVVDRTKLNAEDDDALKEEVAILRKMNHKHIVKLYDFFEEPKKYFIVLEICEGGELFDRIVQKKHYNEKEARDLVKILFDAIGYCHDCSVVHRDLKPENLLLDNGRDDANIKIADFGFAQQLSVPNSLTTQCGTPGYVAPEILKGIPYGESVDIWSAGVITYILLGGYPPFYDENQTRMFRKIKKGEYKFHSPMWDDVSEEAKDLIKKLLVTDPTQRITARQALSHQWVTLDDKTLEGRALPGTMEELKKFNAKRKFRAGVGAVMAMNKLKDLKSLMAKSSTVEDTDEMDTSGQQGGAAAGEGGAGPAKPAAVGLAGVVTAAKEGTGQAAEKATGAFANAVKAAKGKEGEAKDKVEDAVNQAKADVTQKAEAVKADVTAKAEAAKADVTAKAEAAIDKSKGKATEKVEALKGEAAAAVEKGKAEVTKKAEAVKADASAALDKSKGEATAAVDKAKAEVTAKAEAAKAEATAAIDNSKGKAEAAVAQGKAAVEAEKDKVVDQLSGSLNDATKAAEEQKDKAAAALRGAFGK